ncbi:MAG TPA: hypothetical protein VIL85_16475 [Thermomicrobiales bacterium]
MRAVEMLENQYLVQEIATLKIAAAGVPDPSLASAGRVAALLAECRRRRLGLRRPAEWYALSPRCGPARDGRL